MFVVYVFFFFKQKTADEMRISDWSSDVCSSDLNASDAARFPFLIYTSSLALRLEISAISDAAKNPFSRIRERMIKTSANMLLFSAEKIGRASCRERVCQYV